MSDELDRLRRLRPDEVQPDFPAEPALFSRHKEHLMSTISDEQREVFATMSMPDLYPRLAYEDQRSAVAYLERVFQLSEIREARMDNGDHILAWLRMGDGVVMVGPTNREVHQIISPSEVGGTTAQMMVYVHDVDAHYAHAEAEGADITMALQDAFYGERLYEATDLEGHRWHFAERFDAIKARGGPVPDQAPTS